MILLYDPVTNQHDILLHTQYWTRHYYTIITKMKKKRILVVSLTFLLCIIVGLWHIYKPLPNGISAQGEVHSISGDDITFLSDITYLDKDGQRVSEQEIFPEVFAMIDEAQEYILIDMFLFNDMLGTATESYKGLSGELTQKLLAKKQSSPDISITFITDPINTVYGGDTSQHINAMQQAGINVIITDVKKLRDSNPVYSAPWRIFGQWWGNSSSGGWLPHVMDARRGKLTLRTYLRLFNFKANHRKIMIADYQRGQKSGIATLVTSANPHDGSSAHSNVALRIDSALWSDVLRSEQAVADFSDATIPNPPIQLSNQNTKVKQQVEGDIATVQLLTEGKIKNALVRQINASKAGDQIDMMMFYLSDRDIVKAIKDAGDRGVKIRMILDPNKDAFGREKNGVPNRQIAHEIISNGGDVSVRWCNTHGEQCHAKMTLFTSGEAATIIMGSANLTRRNIGDYNLETNVIVKSSRQTRAIKDANELFTSHWENRNQRQYTLDYQAYSDESISKMMLYKFMEATGLSSF